ncbi:hypothetical protein TTRE_0000221301 [Trichuris trichiura]|uniref:Uncharacterized protein n=1 Tax=Trichuris trichiura TaxID=36087 RepID=A0A077Z212_TRITR|nr:hypothetical protein TTRE_0000221301 [Trichuris trichiura]
MGSCCSKDDKEETSASLVSSEKRIKFVKKSVRCGDSPRYIKAPIPPKAVKQFSWKLSATKPANPKLAKNIYGPSPRSFPLEKGANDVGNAQGSANQANEDLLVNLFNSTVVPEGYERHLTRKAWDEPGTPPRKKGIS